MVLHVFVSLLGGVPLCIPYGLYSGTSLGWTTRGTLEGYPGRVLSTVYDLISQRGALNQQSISSFLPTCSFHLLFHSFFCKTKAKRGISLKMNEYGVNLALKDQYIREIHT